MRRICIWGHKGKYPVLEGSGEDKKIIGWTRRLPENFSSGLCDACLSKLIKWEKVKLLVGTLKEVARKKEVEEIAMWRTDWNTPQAPKKKV